MIDYAKQNDDVLPLFEHCFESTEQFNNYFFLNIYKPENTLVYKVNNEIVAMLQMINFDTSIGKTMYLFAVCTDPKYRKQGISSMLINKSFEVAAQKGCNSVILIPEQEWLYNFYAKFGFESSLMCEENVFSSYEANEVVKFSLSYEDIPKMIELYNSEVKSGFYIKRSEDYFKWQIDMYFDGAIGYKLNGVIIGYSFGYIKDEAVILDELISSNTEQCLCSYSNTHIRYRTPYGDKNLGMIKILSGEKPIGGYINLLFN